MKFFKFDTIQKRVILVVALALMALCALLYSIFSVMTLNSFTDREIQNYENKATIARLLLNSSVEYIPAVTRDWSSWDLTYDFVLGNNPDYPEETITDYPFQLYNLNVCAILDLDGNILLEKRYDSRQDTEPEITDDLSETFIHLNALTESTMEDYIESDVSNTLQFGVAGYAQCGENWYYFTSLPVLPSDEDQPFAGSFIFGRLIDSTEIKRITSGNSDYKFELVDISSGLYTELKSYIKESNERIKITHDTKNNKIHAYSFIDNIFKDNYLILSMDGNLELYESGVFLLQYLLYAIIMVFAVILVLIIYILRKMVILPLIELGDDVKMITTNSAINNINSGYPFAEFNLLANKINEMLARLNLNRKMLQQSIVDLEMFKQTIMSAKDGIIIFDNEGNIVYANPAFIESMAYAEYELLDTTKNINDIIFNLTTPNEKTLIMDMLKSGSAYSGEITILRNDGTKSIDDITATPIMSGNDTIEFITVIKRNIEEKKNYEDLLKYQASHDMLTSLPNRLDFTNKLNEFIAVAKAKGHKTAIFFLDLNNFKMINDTLGHGAGDELLQKVARRITTNFPVFDCVARMGGDEFSIIIGQFNDITVIDKFAQEILAIFEAPYKIKNRDFVITAAIGSSVYPDDGSDAETLIRNSDTAMYKAKSMAKNYYQPFSSELHVMINNRMTLEYSIRIAMEKHEFAPYFQPKILTNTNRVFGSESLIRWLSPDGMIPPDRFIPLADETGLIVPMTQWMLKDVCKKNKELIDFGIHNSVAVNIPSQVLQHKDFFDMIYEALDYSGMPAKYLDVELTEGTLIIDSEFTLSILKKLHAMGMEISIDDFGTGYSSLSYLKKYPITRIKIDRSFVMETPQDAESATIVQAIIAMTKGLNLKTTAEGIETPEQLAFLRSLGCDEGQGYLISRPLPFDDYKNFLTNVTSTHKQW